MDARRGERKGLIYNLRATEVETGRVVGYIWDASAGGLMLMCERPLDVGAPLDLAVDVPHARESEEPVRLQVTTRWCERDSDSEFFKAGLVLDPSQDQAAAALSRIISRYHYVEPADSRETYPRRPSDGTGATEG